MKKLMLTLSTVFIVLLLSGWGNQGHYTISKRSIYSLPAEMLPLINWELELANHASDADNRKGSDPTESPKHFIDIDNYQTFLTDRRIPQTYDSVVQLYTQAFVIQNGTLPWATLASFDSLKNCFARRDWPKVIIFASDLGHYVADGHMPLHITKNYDGKLTNQSGIHSRFESTMINSYLAQIQYTGSTPQVVENVNQYVFKYIYSNYKYVDSTLTADNYAYSIASNRSSTAYYNAMWTKSQKFVNVLFKDASKALATLIYTAWVKAGSPKISTNLTQQSELNSSWKVFPNPSKGLINIELNLIRSSSDLSLRIFNLMGQCVQKVQFLEVNPMNFKYAWETNIAESGIYFIEIDMDGVKTNRKLIVSKP